MSDEEVVPTVEQPVEAESAPASPPQHEDVQKQNWKEIRSQLRQLKEEKEALQREVQKMASQAQKQPDDDVDFRPDDLVDAKTAKRMAEKLVEKRLEELQRQQASTMAELQLRAKFPDIDDVVTPNALDKLKEEEPELYQSLAQTADPYTRGAAAYRMLKKVEKASRDPYDRERAKAEKNLSKPSPSHAVKGGSSEEATPFMNGLTPELKAKLYKEMKDAARRIN